MLSVERKVLYSAFGLSVISEIPLPELPYLSTEGQADVEIKIADLSKIWLRLSAEEDTFVVRENFVMFYAPDIAVFSVQEGKVIKVSPVGNGCEDEIRLYLLGTCMGALLMQRKTLPLHGSAIAVNGKAYALIGERGAGKSTFAAALLRNGCKLLSDDVIAVSPGENNVLHVTPSYPQQKLWENSLNAFGMDPDQYSPLFRRETKYAVPVHSDYLSEPMPLAGVFELIKTDKESLTVIPIEGLERLRTLYVHTFRQFLLNPLGLRSWHLQTTARLANQIHMFRLQRTTLTFTVDSLASIVLKTIDRENEE